MSFEATTQVWEKSSRSGSHKLVLLCIAHHQNSDTGKAWPSVKRIAEMCGLKRRQVFDILRDLSDSGEITRESGAKFGQVNRYSVTLNPRAGVRLSAHLSAGEAAPGCADDLTPPVRSSAHKSSLNKKPESAKEPQEGRKSAALSADDLVKAGIDHAVAVNLLASQRAMGKRSITATEFDAFVIEVGRAPGWEINEVAEAIAAGDFCRYLPEFKAQFLPPRNSLAQPAVVLPNLDLTGSVSMSLSARAQALGAMRRAGHDPLLSGAIEGHPFGAADQALHRRGTATADADDIQTPEETA